MPKNEIATLPMMENAAIGVGEAGFEPAATRPPDVYSNRAELLSVTRVQSYNASNKLSKKTFASCKVSRIWVLSSLGLRSASSFSRAPFIVYFISFKR